MPLPNELNPESTVLFLGSGFSSGATAIYGKSPPVGDGLRDILADRLGVPRDKYSLQMLGNAFSRRPNLNLYTTFQSIFTISSVNTDQKEIFSRKWLRIYTTNYDDAVELAYRLNGIHISSYNYDDIKPAKLPRSSIIHLHGFIHRATEENLLEQLVLSQKTYVRQGFEKSAWYDEFRRDLLFSDACFFIGYSLQDSHITALIPRKNHVKGKSYFIVKGKLDELLLEDIQEYGEVHSIETSGFAQLCKTLPASKISNDLNDLKVLRYINVFRDQKAVLDPTPIEVFELVTYGRFKEQRCLSSLPNVTYVVPRKVDVQACVEYVNKSTTLLVHSRLGNGKSIFLWSLAFALIQSGFSCFKCDVNSPVIEQEINIIKNISKVVILFDDYDTAISSIDRFRQMLPSAKYVITVRTSVQDVRVHEIVNILPAPLRRHGINHLSYEDKDDFISIVEQAGVTQDDFRNLVQNATEMREIVTTIYENESIRQKINHALRPVFQDKKALAVIATGLILTWTGQTGETSLFMEILDLDPHVVLSKYHEIADDIFSLENDMLQARSPIFAEYLLQNQFQIEEILLLIRRMLIVAVSRKKERRYRAMLSSLMSFSQLLRLLKAFPDAGARSGNFMESCKEMLIYERNRCFGCNIPSPQLTLLETMLPRGF